LESRATGRGDAETQRRTEIDVLDVTELTDELSDLLVKNFPYEFAPSIGCDVLDVVDAFTGRFLRYPSPEAHWTHVLWIAHCPLMDWWNHSPRLLVVNREAGCGKTQLLLVTEQLVPAPILVSAPSEAFLRDVIECGAENHGVAPTLLVDEMDVLWGGHRSKESELVRRLVDDGYSRSGSTGRKIGKKAKTFPEYAALAIGATCSLATIHRTIRSRSIVILMQRAPLDDLPEDWDVLTASAEAEPIRKLLRRWVTFIGERALEYRPSMPEGVANRDADKWRPQLTIGELAGGHWAERARAACVAFVSSETASTEVSEGVEVLWEIRHVYDFHKLSQDHNRLSTVTVLEGLKAAGFSWAGMPPKSSGRKLAQILADYAIAPAKDMWIGTGATKRKAKGYERGQFTRAWAAYPEPCSDETDETDAPDKTNKTKTDRKDSTDG
jgi:uncharacterized protein DUF3631